MSEQPLPNNQNISPEEATAQAKKMQEIMAEFHQQLDALKVERDTAIDKFVEEKKQARIEEIRQSMLN